GDAVHDEGEAEGVVRAGRAEAGHRAHGGIEEDHGDRPAQLARLAPVERPHGPAAEAHAEVGAQQRPELAPVERAPHRASTRARDVIRVLKPSAALASRPLSGSSKKMAFGLWRSAAVMTTLCRMPFEYPASSSRRSVASASSKNSAKRRMRAAASPSGRP